jgi:hypothetical protein
LPEVVKVALTADFFETRKFGPFPDAEKFFSQNKSSYKNKTRKKRKTNRISQQQNHNYITRTNPTHSRKKNIMKLVLSCVTLMAISALSEPTGTDILTCGGGDRGNGICADNTLCWYEKIAMIGWFEYSYPVADLSPLSLIL